MRYQATESKSWVNRVTGRTASIYGAVPYTDGNKKDWTIESRGFTVKNTESGTVGIGMKPFKTIKEAEELAKRLNA